MSADLDVNYRFENYVVGSANRLAVAAARAVARAPGSTYNPLFLYGPSGLGKTHLMLAVGHLAWQLQPRLRVAFITLDEFVEQLVAAVASGGVSQFKQQYTDVDMLLLDDVQFLTAKKETQNELLRVFNALEAGGRQVVMTSDRPPAEITGLDQRLATRFAGGLIVDIGAPDYETRVAILRKRCDERSVHFASGVVEEVARIGYSNVRELQGALNRLIAVQTLDHADVTAHTVRGLVGAREAVPVGATSRGVPATGEEGGEFASFLSDLAAAVAKHIEAWHLQIREVADTWSARGYRVAMLERAIEGREAPDVDALLHRYAVTIDRLSLLQRTAASLDPDAGESELFMDPDRLEEAERLVERLLSTAEPLGAPVPTFVRATFEVGISNQLAVHAADAVEHDPGRKYNPLFVHGPSGVGKSHLVNAIGNGIVSARGAPCKVAYVNARDFVEEVIRALQDGTIERWRARYRAVDALILDDVQFAGGTERAQEELFHVFNSLHSRGKQIVLASDVAPSSLSQLEDRLRSRFEGGLVVQVKEPDRLLRERLYARALRAAGQLTDHALLEYLADRPVSGAKEIQAAVHRLTKAADVAQVNLSAAFAREELEGGLSVPALMQAAVGVDSAVDPFFLDGEKVVWDWPDVAGRAIEDWR